MTGSTGNAETKGNSCYKNMSQPVYHHSVNLCSNFIDLVLQGYTLNVSGSGLNSINNTELQRKLLGWQKDPKSSPNCHYSQKDLYKTKTIVACCSGYSGEKCDAAVCVSPCRNGGSCTGPNICTCTDEYTGFRCENKKTDKVQANNKLPFATCRNFGPYSFRTFDGLLYDFAVGNCKYTLATHPRQWRIDITMHNCSTLENCKKSLDIKMMETEVHVHGNNITLGNKKNVDLSVGQYYNGISVTKKDKFVYIDNSMLGLKIKFDLESAVYVTLMKSEKGKNIKGLCGSYNGNPNDDFVTRQNENATSAEEFGSSYLIQDNLKPCVPSVVLTMNCQSEAKKQSITKQCNYLKSSKFSACHSKIDVTRWFNLCVNQLCETINGTELKTKCKIFTAYAQECSDASAIIEWRTNTICPITCKDGFEYTECASGCIRTCQNMYNIQQESCFSQCAPGCECPKGTIVDNGTCVRPENCTCTYQKKPYNAQDVLKVSCNQCICEKGRWNCTRNKCASTCQVLSRSYVTTFDGEDRKSVV